MHVADVLDRRRDPADLSAAKHILLYLFRIADTDLQHLVLRMARHETDPISDRNASLFDADKRDDTAVWIVQRIEHQRLQRRMDIPFRRRHHGDDRFQDISYVPSALGGDHRRIAAVQTDDVLDLLFDDVRLCAGQIDLVDDRDDLQVIVKSEIDIGQRLRLHALCRIHDQDRTLTGCQRTGHLIAEIDMAGRVDQMKEILFSIQGGIGQLNGIQLDRDAALLFQIHRIQDLCLHLPFFHRIGQFEDPVCQRRLSVIDVCDDGKITNMTLIHTLPPQNQNNYNKCFHACKEKKDRYRICPYLSKRVCSHCLPIPL